MADRYPDGDDEDAELGGQTSSNGDSPTTSRAPPRKRRRIVVSCTECHRRKQKVGPFRRSMGSFDFPRLKLRREESG